MPVVEILGSISRKPLILSESSPKQCGLRVGDFQVEAFVVVLCASYHILPGGTGSGCPALRILKLISTLR